MERKETILARPGGVFGSSSSRQLNFHRIYPHEKCARPPPAITTSQLTRLARSREALTLLRIGMALLSLTSFHFLEERSQPDWQPLFEVERSQRLDYVLYKYPSISH